MTTHRLLLHSAKQIVQVCADGRRVKKGHAMHNVDVLQNDEEIGYSILVDKYVLIMIAYY